jgi:hypothetical protein
VNHQVATTWSRGLHTLLLFPRTSSQLPILLSSPILFMPCKMWIESLEMVVANDHCFWMFKKAWTLVSLNGWIVISTIQLVITIVMGIKTNVEGREIMNEVCCSFWQHQRDSRIKSFEVWRWWIQVTNTTFKAIKVASCKFH